MIKTIAIVGAGNGGKTAAADLSLRGKRVRLFEFAEFAGALDALRETPELTLHGALEGTARLELATTDLADAVDGADAVMLCTQAPAHERAARELAPLLKPGQLLIFNPGSTGGSLQDAAGSGHLRAAALRGKHRLLRVLWPGIWLRHFPVPRHLGPQISARGCWDGACALLQAWRAA